MHAGRSYALESRLGLARKEAGVQAPPTTRAEVALPHGPYSTAPGTLSRRPIRTHSSQSVRRLPLRAALGAQGHTLVHAAAPRLSRSGTANFATVRRSL